MPIDRDVLEAVREMNEHELRRLTSSPRLGSRAWVRTCRDPGRRSNSGSNWSGVGRRAARAARHGPYWYAYWTEDGRRRSRTLAKSRMFREGAGPA